MARFPRIESPCPLSEDEQRRIDGDCRRCNKRVHALDALNDGERAAFVASATGSLCVSYRVPAHRMTGLGLAMAATLVAGSALAGDASTPTETAAFESEQGSEKLEFISIIVGGIEDPANASWIDDSDLPDLPMVVEARSIHKAPEALLLKDSKPLH